MITLLLSRFVLIGALTFGSDRDKNAEGLIAIKLVLCVVGGGIYKRIHIQYMII